MNETFDNPLLITDSYKVTHWKQYPPGTTRVFSYLESRGGMFPEVTFFGLQYILKRWLEDVVVTYDRIQEAEDFCHAHFGFSEYFNKAGWEYIKETHGGRLPLEIKAVPEGTTVPTSNALLTVVNTDTNVPWLTNYFETLLCQVWYPTTVCTLSRVCKKIILHALEETGDPALIDFKLHDFGFRGVSSVESAGIGGLAHLVNFKGTDTMAALWFARRYYGEQMAGFSIPAAEHSTITAWQREGEVDAFANMLRQFPNGLVAVVSDSYDIFRACETLWGKQLKAAVLGRSGVLVIRPDSGDPAEVVIRVLDILGKQFGERVNPKGFRVLNPKVRVIQGDGIDYMMLGRVLSEMTRQKWSADNIAFGSGGGLLQKMDRDTQRFAFKCSAIEVSGIWRHVYKEPVTDPGKVSKSGRLMLVHDPNLAAPGGYATVTEVEGRENQLKTVFLNGETVKEETLETVRNRAAL